MRRIIETGVLIALAAPTVAMAQSAINGTWKLDIGALPFSTRVNVWILQDGRYQCKSCTPPIDVKRTVATNLRPASRTTRSASGF